MACSGIKIRAETLAFADNTCWKSGENRRIGLSIKEGNPQIHYLWVWGYKQKIKKEKLNVWNVDWYKMYVKALWWMIMYMNSSG